MKAYITKYALATGISQVEGFMINDTVFLANNALDHNVYKKGEWHTHEADAQQKAECMRDAEIAKLSEQIEILKAKTF